MQTFDATTFLSIPEIASLDSRTSIVRIPPELDVPLTPRVRRLIDAQAFRRLSGVSQLGFVKLVYPGAVHTRFEHSLGVFRLSLLLLKRLAYEERFASIVGVKDAETFILAALLHDVGHFPYCHLLEDIKEPNVPSHEEAATEVLDGELGEIIREDWDIDPQDVARVIAKRAPTRSTRDTDANFARRQKAFKLLSSILSGPVDIDKMDYLMRDSQAAGVPYGKNYDLDRLIGSFCLNERGDGIAVSSKGKTAAELMVFARYVMFSEVYWHHASRAATIMFQRAVELLARQYGFGKLVAKLAKLSDAEVQTFLLGLCRQRLFGASEADVSATTRATCADEDGDAFDARLLLQGIFGPKRTLFKRLLQFNATDEPDLYRRIAGRPYREVCEIAKRLAIKLGVAPRDVLVDAPPVDKEVEFNVDVFYPTARKYRPLSSVSPVVRALAKEQFDDYVKQARVFAAPEVVSTLRANPRLGALVRETLDEMEAR